MSKVLQKLAATRLNPEEETEKVVVPKKGGAKGAKKAQNDESNEVVEGDKTKLSLQLRPVATKGKKEAAAKETAPSSSIIYLGHIPKGFFESEMRKFFSQFGTVKRLKLFRSRKTNNSKGYAFIEFESSEVAAVVAESMNGYFLSDRQLKAHVVTPDKIHDGMFKFHYKRKDGDDDESSDEEEGEGDNEKKAEEKAEQPLVTDENVQELLKKRESAMEKKLKKLQSLGIEYTIPQIAGADAIKTEAPATKKAAPKKTAKAAEKVVEAPAPVEELEEIPVAEKPKKKAVTKKQKAVEEAEESAAPAVVAKAAVATEDKPKKKKAKVAA